jgi:hypothetical protein
MQLMGLWLVSAAFQTFIFASMIRALGVVLPKRSQARPIAKGKGASALGVVSDRQE